MTLAPKILVADDDQALSRTLSWILKENGYEVLTVPGGEHLFEHLSAEQFDLLLLDAFNSDSIPVHLVSREAVRMYLSKLKRNGLLMFHVSNRYMNVEGLISAVVSDASLNALIRHDSDQTPPLKAQSTRPSPTCSRILATEVSMKCSMVQVGLQPQMRNTKLSRTSLPRGVCATSG